MKREWIWLMAGMGTALAIGLVAIALRPKIAPSPREKEMARLTASLKDPDPRKRKDAARALGKMGPEAEKAIPDLRRALNDDPVVAIWAHYALAEITETDEPSVSAIIAKLRDENDDVRGQAATALGEMGPKAEKALPELMRVVAEDRNPGVKFNAGLAVPKMKGKAVPILIEALRDKRDIVRRYAAQTLGNIGPEASAAIPALKDVEARDSDDVTRAAAKWAISRISGG
ncbi:MAG: HEAT repeat domain-containing protein [Planctomycetota bacterium]|nr:HEAT repeat domain-containing protein [Planctomycetota bacterium]